MAPKQILFWRETVLLNETWRRTAAATATPARWRRCWRRLGLRTTRWTSRSSSTWKGSVLDVHADPCADVPLTGTGHQLPRCRRATSRLLTDYEAAAARWKPHDLEDAQAEFWDALHGQVPDLSDVRRRACPFPGRWCPPRRNGRGRGPFCVEPPGGGPERVRMVRTARVRPASSGRRGRRHGQSAGRTGLSVRRCGRRARQPVHR